LKADRKLGEHQMRDIRNDLQDRANLIAEQISTAQGQLDKHIEQLRREHAAKLEELRSALHSVNVVIGIEDRLGSSLSGTQAEFKVTPPNQHLPQQPQRPLSDALIRKVASVGAR
jgi:hypothetical protein